MDISNKTEQQSKLEKTSFAKNIIAGQEYKSKSPLEPLKSNYGISFGQRMKYEYKSKLFGKIKIIFTNSTSQWAYNVEHYSNPVKDSINIIKSAKYPKPTSTITVICDNGFKLSLEIVVEHSYYKLTKNEILDKVRPKLEEERKKLKKNKILMEIDNLINYHKLEQENEMFEDYIM